MGWEMKPFLLMWECDIHCNNLSAGLHFYQKKFNLANFAETNFVCYSNSLLLEDSCCIIVHNKSLPGAMMQTNKNKKIAS